MNCLEDRLELENLELLLLDVRLRLEHDPPVLDDLVQELLLLEHLEFVLLLEEGDFFQQALDLVFLDLVDL